MRSVTKQSQKAGGVLTREVHLGVDGPLAVHLSDQVILVDQKGQKVQFPAERLMQMFGDCPHKEEFARMKQQIQELQQQLQALSEKCCAAKEQPVCQQCPCDEKAQAPEQQKEEQVQPVAKEEQQPVVQSSPGLAQQPASEPNQAAPEEKREAVQAPAQVPEPEQIQTAVQEEQKPVAAVVSVEIKKEADKPRQRGRAKQRLDGQKN